MSQNVKSTTVARTREASWALRDARDRSRAVYHGGILVLANDLHTVLRTGKLADLAYPGESDDDIRDALRAYGEWLIRVADRAA